MKTIQKLLLAISILSINTAFGLDGIDVAKDIATRCPYVFKITKKLKIIANNDKYSLTTRLAAQQMRDKISNIFDEYVNGVQMSFTGNLVTVPIKNITEQHKIALAYQFCADSCYILRDAGFTVCGNNY